MENLRDQFPHFKVDKKEINFDGKFENSGGVGNASADISKTKLWN